MSVNKYILHKRIGITAMLYVCVSRDRERVSHYIILVAIRNYIATHIDISAEVTSILSVHNVTKIFIKESSRSHALQTYGGQVGRGRREPGVRRRGRALPTRMGRAVGEEYHVPTIVSTECSKGADEQKGSERLTA